MHDRIERNMRYRERKRKRVVCAIVEADEATIDFLQKSRWLSENDTHDASRIGAAIEALLLSVRL